MSDFTRHWFFDVYDMTAMDSFSIYHDGMSGSTGNVVIDIDGTTYTRSHAQYGGWSADTWNMFYFYWSGSDMGMQLNTNSKQSKGSGASMPTFSSDTRNWLQAASARAMSSDPKCHAANLAIWSRNLADEEITALAKGFWPTNGGLRRGLDQFIHLLGTARLRDEVSTDVLSSSNGGNAAGEFKSHRSRRDFVYFAKGFAATVLMQATCTAVSGANAAMSVDPYNLLAPAIAAVSTCGPSDLLKEKELQGTIDAVSNVPAAVWDPGIGMHVTPSAVSTVNGSMAVDRELAGVATAIATCDARMDKQPFLAGTVTAVSIVGTAEMTFIKEISGSITAVTTVNGNAVYSTALRGTITAQVTCQGTMIYQTASLSGGVTALSNATGRVDMQPALVGSITAQSSVTGRANVTFAMSGSVSGVSNVANSVLIATWSLSGSVTCVSTVNGSATPTRALSGSINAASIAAASLAATWSLSGTVDAHASLAAAPLVDRELRGTIAGQSGVAALLSSTKLIAASFACTSVVGPARLDKQPFMGGTINASSGVSAAAAVDRSIAGRVDAHAGLLATLSRDLIVSGSLSAGSTAAGFLSTIKSFAGSAAAASNVASTNLIVNWGLRGVVSAQSTAVGVLVGTWSLDGRIEARASVSAPLRTVYTQGPFQFRYTYPVVAGLRHAEVVQL
jgi:hypothetical protein